MKKALVVGWDNIMGISLSKTFSEMGIEAEYVDDTDTALHRIRRRKYCTYLINDDRSYNGKCLTHLLEKISEDNRKKVIVAGTFPSPMSINYARCINVGVFLKQPFTKKLLEKSIQQTFQEKSSFTFIRESKDTLDYLIMPSGWCSNLIEVVSFLENGKCSMCLSAQTGCAMGCRFCTTGSNPATSDAQSIRNLWVEELHTCRETAERIHFDDPQEIRINISGMGEPSLNPHIKQFITELDKSYPGKYSYKFSTIGLFGPLGKFLRDFSSLGIVSDVQLSLHFADEMKRHKYMRGTKNNPLAKVIPLILEYIETARTVFTINVIPLLGINDTDQDIEALKKILLTNRTIMALMEKGFCRLRLSHFNENFYDPRCRPTTNERFEEILTDLRRDLIVQEFSSLGTDLGVGCGQLSAALESYIT